MRKAAMVLLVAMVLSAMTAPVFAGGDKNRGSKGKGNVNQHQVRNK